MARHRITVDTGGTFSDFVHLNEDTGEIIVHKLPSTPDDPARAILTGIGAVLATGVDSGDVVHFCHGTTVGTNALLEGTGAKTALLVTQGFRGVYPVGEQARPYGAAIFDVMYDKPAMLVPARLIREVDERVDFSGRVLRALDEAALRETVGELRDEGVASIAVCLLFSFLHAGHEKRAREIILEQMPDCSVSLSCEVLPQIREYYRLSTTVINAYLQPIIARYIAELARGLHDAGIRTPRKYVMQSNGGIASFEAASHRPVATVLSGPAGGVAAAIGIARAAVFPNLITFDMGGTSCDVALIKDGEPHLATRGKIDGRDIALPMLDIHTVSAGGGTIAQVDRFGMLQVGPQSAGAMPGPACYGRGGEAATITDCNLMLGLLDPRTLLGGRMLLESERAECAIESGIARPLGITPIDAAEGVVRVIDVKMAEAIKAISTMRGHDLREFMLLAFGGAGPLHGARLARDLGMRGMIVPRYPGVFSALGLMLSDVVYDFMQSKLMPLAANTEEVNGIFQRLTTQACESLRRDGFAGDHIRMEAALDMRYAGQGYELGVPCPLRPLQVIDLEQLRGSFDHRHESSFGHMAPAEAVEIVSFRVRATGLLPPAEIRRSAGGGRTRAAACRATRRVRLDGKDVDCPVYQREELEVGVTVGGPAIFEQMDCTISICAGQVAQVDEWKNLIVGSAP